MAILVNSKYKEDPIKIEGARVAPTQNIVFSNTQGQVTPQSMVEASFELIRDLMTVLVACKNEQDPIRKGAGAFTTSFPL